jgi:dihydroorotate dehydrogenase
MTFYESVLRPLLFRVPPDRAHDLSHAALKAPGVWSILGGAARFSDARLRTDLAGIRLENPVGLAPGFDKNGTLLGSLAELGFGYIVVGSITRASRSGNPTPRLARYPRRLSIANCMGLPNLGLQAAIEHLRQRRHRPVPVIASVAVFSSDELLECARGVEPYVDGVEIGLVCPNTTETERMEELRVFTALAEGLARSKRKPVFVKLPPHHTDAAREQVGRMVEICLRVGLEGVSVSGSRPVEDSRLSVGRGSLAGKDTFADALRIVQDVGQVSRGRLAIKASGGVFSGEDARLMLEAGATTVEVYSSFIYRGWGIANQINRELAAALDRARVSSLAALQAAPRAEAGVAAS